MISAIDTFRTLHTEGCFLMPNPHDIGLARLFEAAGHVALATTSAGFAATRGRLDETVAGDELLAHAAELTAAVGVPLNVDAERCYGNDPAAVTAFVAALGLTGAAGCSIEDWNPTTGAIDPLDVAAARVRAAADGAAESGMVLTARCENHLHGVDDLDDTIARLVAYAGAGAECVYAPGLVHADEIARVVGGTGRPVNVLVLPGSPTLPELADLGVRRVSTGGSPARIGYGAAVATVDSLLTDGTYPADTPWLDRTLSDRAWADRTGAVTPD